MSAVRTRMAGLGDLADVIALERGVWEAPHWADTDYSEIVGAAAGAVQRCLFVAEVRGGLNGFAVGKVIGAGVGRSAELESVAVRADARRSGVGRALCGAVVEWCRTQGASTLELEVRGASAGAIALYMELGFVTVGRRREYYRDPTDEAVLMRLDLA